MFFRKFLKKNKPIEEIFTEIYQKNDWKSKESRSGPGSTMAYTEILRKELPILFKELGIKKILDVPCGDFNWMRELDLSILDHYLGIDIVFDLIQKNKKLYQKKFSNVEFKKMDILMILYLNQI